MPSGGWGPRERAIFRRQGRDLRGLRQDDDPRRRRGLAVHRRPLVPDVRMARMSGHSADYDAPPCVHCGAPVGPDGQGDWVHERGLYRCQSPNVAYGHLAHPAGVPCRADGPNPCLGARDAGLTTETYRRDDGWEVAVTHDGEVVTEVSHLPMLVLAPPDPLTIEYVRQAFAAHGYTRILPPGKGDQ